MKLYLQPTLLGLAILLIFSCFAVNADTAKMTPSEVTYEWSYERGGGRIYHRFLPSPAPEGLHYHGKMIATANINNTPEKEKIALIGVGTKPHAPSSEWVQAFLLIADRDLSHPKYIDVFKLFGTGTHPLDVPTAKPIELHSPPFDFTQPTEVSFKIIDLTGDGILDVWVESVHGVALISFEDGAFKEVFSRHTVTREKLAETPDVEYHRYDHPPDPKGQIYHRFLPDLPPEGPYYSTRMKAIANIDDTPEKENIVLMVANSGEELNEWVRAFLLIVDTEVEGVLKKKDFFNLFDSGAFNLDVPGKVIEVRNPPFVFRKLAGGFPWSFKGVSFEFVDLTGDGILDLWAEHAQGIAVISFQNGEFKEVCSAYSTHRRLNPMEYIDIDNDGIYEIKIPDRISVDGPMAAALPWVSLYEWDGNTYRLNNKRFYADNDKFLIRLLQKYILRDYFTTDEIYHFYIGLVYYYRDNVPMARALLQRVVKHGKKQDYRKAAESILKKLPTD